jgi:hypothetical protein
MDEHVLGAVIRLDEAVAFLGIEEFHGTDGHQISFHASVGRPASSGSGNCLSFGDFT